MTAAPAPLPLLVAAICADAPEQAGRLILMDVTTGHLFVDAAPAPCRRPVLSCDGRYIAFEMNGDVALASVADPLGTVAVLAPALAAEDGAHTFQFDATGNWIAVAVANGVLILPTSPSVGDGRRLSLPPQLEPVHLVWSETGGTLALTARTPEQWPITVWLDASTGHPLGMANGSAALAVPNDDGVWTVEPIDGRPAAQASILERGGFSPAIYTCPDDRLILGWLPRRFEVALGAFAEDAGDDADIVVADVRGGESRPLIQGLRGVRALPASPDGAWVAVLLDDDPLAVHLFATASGGATRLQLPASPDEDIQVVVAEAVCGPAFPRGEGGTSWR